MAEIKAHLQPTVEAIYQAWQQMTPPDHRHHLGASLIGRECARQLWYVFRWCKKPEFSGRVLRLFHRGHNEEFTFNKELRAAGVVVHELDPTTGEQWRIADIGGHFGGSLDGIAEKGIVEAPGKAHVLEYKTHGSKSFAKLQKEGVKASKPEHYGQMQVYMHYKKIDRAFYLAVNKDSDELYSERIRYKKEDAIALIEKAAMIVMSDTPPAKISDSPASFKCKWCDLKEICHGRKLPEVSCRTCTHATPDVSRNGAIWTCAKWSADIPKECQSIGCDSHLYIPALVTYADAIDASESDNCIVYEKEDGTKFINGGEGYSSKELERLDHSLIAESGIELLRKTMGAEVVSNVNT